MPDPTTLASRRGGDVLRWIAAELAEAAIPTWRIDAEFILAETLGIPPADVRAGAADAVLLRSDELSWVLAASARLADAARS